MEAYADLVFHVLAHVRGSAHLASSVYDAHYVAFAERHLGPAHARTLAEDAELLGQVLVRHDTLASVQCLAWLFATTERAASSVERDFADLRDEDVDHPPLLASLKRDLPVVEVLRAAVDLEAPHHARLPPARFDAAVARATITAARDVAPRLADTELHFVRALRLRGRVIGRSIWVGTPDDEVGPSIDHLVMQAAHEATVREVEEAMRTAGLERSFSVVEIAAVAWLADRARTLGGERARQHAEWLEHFGGKVVPAPLSSLAPALQSMLARK